MLRGEGTGWTSGAGPADETREDGGREALLRRLAELEARAAPLEPDAADRARLREAAVASSERFLEALGALKVFDDDAGTGLGLLEAPISEGGTGLEEVMGLVDREVVLPGAATASGGHLAYIPGGGLYHSALGDFLAAVSNKYAGLFYTGPGAVRMENLLLRWVADLVGYPAAAGGNLTSGGSLATLAAVAAARDAHGLRGRDLASAVVYLSEQTHHCMEKALCIAGLGEVQRRLVPLDEGFRMRPEALERLLAEDRRRGLRPWLITAAAGTTDTGAVDPLEALANLAEREGCWFHVDAAYGGFFLLTELGRSALGGIERSHSVILDPHKGLFLPYGSGIVLVRQEGTLAAPHDQSGAYMQDARDRAGETSPCDVSGELSKHFRALRMWLPLVLLGVRPFRAALEEKLLLARYFYREIGAAGFEVGPPPELSVVTFRWAPAGGGLEETNRFNRALVEGVRRDGRIFLSSTTIDGRFVLRLAALSFRTHRRTVDLAVQILREQVEALRAG